MVNHPGGEGKIEVPLLPGLDVLIKVTEEQFSVFKAKNFFAYQAFHIGPLIGFDAGNLAGTQFRHHAGMTTFQGAQFQHGFIFKPTIQVLLKQPDSVVIEQC